MYLRTILPDTLNTPLENFVEMWSIGLHIRVSEGKETLLEQTVTIGQLSGVQTPTCSLMPDREGFHLSYIGSDGTSLKAHIDVYTVSHEDIL